MFTLEAAKKSFFDRVKVTTALEKARHAALSNLGARVMTTARRSIRPRKGTSKPGSPPFSHLGTLRRGILFGRDDARDSVVIGPVLLGSMSGAPENLEYGGQAVVTGLRGRIRGKRVKIAPRPTMVPALAREIPKTPEQFRNIIH